LQPIEGKLLELAPELASKIGGRSTYDNLDNGAPARPLDDDKRVAVARDQCVAVLLQPFLRRVFSPEIHGPIA
jgi:hypothetical protein